MTPFHLAIAVSDLEKSKRFYIELLGCKAARSSSSWVDLNFHGHQLTLHQVQQSTPTKCTNPVDGKSVPIPHFGVILSWEQWQQCCAKLSQADVKFMIEPHVRFKGQVGEQGTLFFQDPSGNVIELKAFKDQERLFAH